MAEKQLMVDSSILIDYFRKTNKANSKLLTHFINYNHLYISSVTEFEVINGATKSHLEFWDGMLKKFTVLDFDSKAARKAADIVANSKLNGKQLISLIYLSHLLQ